MRSACRQASIAEIPSSRANSSMAATVASPIPRFGVLITRRRLTTSFGFVTTRRYASTSLISLRW